MFLEEEFKELSVKNTNSTPQQSQQSTNIDQNDEQYQLNNTQSRLEKMKETQEKIQQRRTDLQTQSQQAYSQNNFGRRKNHYGQNSYYGDNIDFQNLQVFESQNNKKPQDLESNVVMVQMGEDENNLIQNSDNEELTQEQKLEKEKMKQLMTDDSDDQEDLHLPEKQQQQQNNNNTQQKQQENNQDDTSNGLLADIMKQVEQQQDQSSGKLADIMKQLEEQQKQLDEQAQQLKNQQQQQQQNQEKQSQGGGGLRNRNGRRGVRRGNTEDQSQQPQEQQQQQQQQENGEQSTKQPTPNNYIFARPDPNFQIQDMKSFLKSPLPKGFLMQATIKRDRSGMGKFYPKYHVFMSSGFRYLMSSKKRSGNKTSNYIIGMDKDNLDRKHSSFLGKVRSNFMGSEFHVYDDGENPNQSKSIENVREELAVVLYDNRLSGEKGPTRKMRILIPDVDDNTGQPKACKPIYEQDTLIGRYKSGELSGMRYYHNKSPKWNPNLKAFVLNFNGRVDQPSVKNFQLIDYINEDIVYLQFGRVAEDVFHMDLQYPFSPMQAFGICISSFDYKFACE